MIYTLVKFSFVQPVALITHVTRDGNADDTDNAGLHGFFFELD